ncbi:MAG TPA: hypothetical protein VFB58_02395 [Chloroflexota bacterium]|nr:hypothetical protein [Chloroflexota bacterium]
MTIPAEQGKLHTYQWLLRALGAYLDMHPSCRISLAEVPGGFLVRLQRVLHKLEPEVYKFHHDSLKEQLDLLFEQKRASGPVHHQGVWAPFPNGHADFLRALGYELDQEGARNILIDELEDGIVVTYSKPDGPDWQKRMVFLAVSDMESILNAAFERRGTSA